MTHVTSCLWHAVYPHVPAVRAQATRQNVALQCQTSQGVFLMWFQDLILKYSYATELEVAHYVLDV